MIEPQIGDKCYYHCRNSNPPDEPAAAFIIHIIDPDVLAYEQTGESEVSRFALVDLAVFSPEGGMYNKRGIRLYESGNERSTTDCGYAIQKETR